MRNYRLLLTCLLNCTSFLLYSQGEEYQKILLTRDDTVKVQNLIMYGRKYMDTDTVVANMSFQKAIEISDAIHYYRGAGQSWISVGYIKAQAGAYRQAIESYSNAVANWKRLNNNSQVTRCLNTIGTLYEFLGRRDSAMIVYMQSVKLLENTTEQASLGSTYNYIGILYNNTGNFEKAVYYQEKAVDILRKAKDTAYLIEALTELSDTYVAKNDPQRAIYLSREGLQLAHLINRSSIDRSILATAYYSIALAHLGLDQLDSATSEAKLCIMYAKATGDLNTYGGGALVLSDSYHQLGKESERYMVLKDAVEVCHKTGNIILLQYTYERLADAAYRLNKHRQAFDYHKNFVKYKDSLFNQKNQDVISELEVKYQTAEKEKVLSQQRLSMAEKEVQLQESRRITVYSIASALIAFFAAMIVYLYFRGRRKLHHNQLQAIQREREIQLLQAVMQGEEKERSRIAKDLHDGVAGMLAAVKMHFTSISLNNGAVTQTEGYQQGVQLLDEACREVRKTSHNLMPELLLRHGLDEAIRRYCGNINNSSKLLVQYDSIGDARRFVDSFELSVYRIVQELLNNIVKHSGASESIVQLSFQPGLLSITIEDNGIGLSNESLLQEGMGLHSLNMRVKAINGKIELDSDEARGLNAYLEFETNGLELKKEEYKVLN